MDPLPVDNTICWKNFIIDGIYGRRILIKNEISRKCYYFSGSERAKMLLATWILGHASKSIYGLEIHVLRIRRQADAHGETKKLNTMHWIFVPDAVVSFAATFFFQ